MAEPLNVTTHYYESLDRETLIEHCISYAESLHTLTHEVQVLRLRLQMIEKNRVLFGG